MQAIPRRFIPLAAAFLVAPLSAQFGSGLPLTDALGIVDCLAAVDMDNDGQLDVVAQGNPNRRLVWFRNLGAGQFAALEEFAATPSTLPGFATGDLDGDGQVDLLRPHQIGQLEWRRGLAPGEFGPGELLNFWWTAGSCWGRFPGIADVTGDGIEDVFCGSAECGVHFLPGLGGGQFGVAQSVDTNRRITHVEPADINGDGRLDLVYYDDQFEQARSAAQDPSGGFTSGALLGAMPTGQYRLVVGDLDGDGDPDLASGDLDSVRWLENTGGSWVTRMLPLTGWASDVAIGDPNADGIADLVVANHAEGVTVFFGTGSGLFASAVSFATELEVWEVELGDLNGDGVDDVLASSREESVMWLPGIPGGGSVLGPLGSISASPQDVQDVAVVDWGLDGDSDLLWASSGDDSLRLARQVASGPSLVVSTLDSDCGECYLVRAVDLDLDGRRDLVYAGDLPDRLYTRLATPGGLGPRQELVLTSPRLSYAQFIDLDADRDPDLVTWGARASVFENEGGVLQPPVLHPNPGGSVGAAVGDVVGDGLPDLAVLQAIPGVIQIEENLGGLTFASPVQAVVNIANPKAIALADLDTDGLLDLVWSATGGMWWAPNEGGGSFGLSQWIGVGGSGGRILPIDLGSDGDTDLLALREFSNHVDVFENTDGTGTMVASVVLGQFDTTSISLGDLDGDGDRDLVAALGAGHQVLWWPGESVQPISAAGCTPDTFNSAGEIATLFTTGSTIAGADELALHTHGLPAGRLGLFLASASGAAPLPVAGSAGSICLGMPIGRFDQSGQLAISSESGTAFLEVGTQALPQGSGPLAALPGETWHFQLWYRDGVILGTSHFSSSAAVTFR